MKISEKREFLILCLYVDILLFIGNNEAMFSEFEMTENGFMSYFLIIEVKQENDGIPKSQQRYMRDILEKFNMAKCNVVNTPVVTGLKLSNERKSEFVNSTVYKSLVGKPEVPYNHKAGNNLW